MEPINQPFPSAGRATGPEAVQKGNATEGEKRVSGTSHAPVSQRSGVIRLATPTLSLGGREEERLDETPSDPLEVDIPAQPAGDELSSVSSGSSVSSPNFTEWLSVVTQSFTSQSSSKSRRSKQMAKVSAPSSSSHTTKAIGRTAAEETATADVSLSSPVAEEHAVLSPNSGKPRFLFKSMSFSQWVGEEEEGEMHGNLVGTERVESLVPASEGEYEKESSRVSSPPPRERASDKDASSHVSPKKEWSFVPSNVWKKLTSQSDSVAPPSAASGPPAPSGQGQPHRLAGVRRSKRCSTIKHNQIQERLASISIRGSKLRDRYQAIGWTPRDKKRNLLVRALRWRPVNARQAEDVRALAPAFGFLELQDVLVAAEVCKRWHQVATCKEFWREYILFLHYAESNRGFLWQHLVRLTLREAQIAPQGVTSLSPAAAYCAWTKTAQPKYTYRERLSMAEEEEKRFLLFRAQKHSQQGLVKAANKFADRAEEADTEIKGAEDAKEKPAAESLATAASVLPDGEKRKDDAWKSNESSLMDAEISEFLLVELQDGGPIPPETSIRRSSAAPSDAPGAAGCQIGLIDADVVRTYGNGRQEKLYSSPRGQTKLRSPIRSSLRVVREEVGFDGNQGTEARTLKRLKNVLCAITASKRDVGYCQGMNFVAALLLRWMDEEASFSMMVNLLEHYDMGTLYGPRLERLGLCLYQLECLVAVHLPELSNHLREEGVEATMYSSSWIMTIFSTFNALPLRVVERLWDIFLVKKWKMVFRVILSVLQRLQADLLMKDFGGILQALHQGRTLEDVSAEELLKESLHFKVTNSMLKALEAMYQETLETNEPQLND